MFLKVIGMVVRYHEESTKLEMYTTLLAGQDLGKTCHWMTEKVLSCSDNSMMYC